MRMLGCGLVLVAAFLITAVRGDGAFPLPLVACPSHTSSVEFAFDLFFQVHVVDPSYQVGLLETLFMESYNEVAECEQDGTFYEIQEVDIRVNPIEYLTDSYTTTTSRQLNRRLEDGVTTQTGSSFHTDWFASVVGTCRGCDDDTSLFLQQEDTRRKLREFLQEHLHDSKEDTTSEDTDRSRSLRFYKGVPGRAIVCDCDPPLKGDVIHEYNELVEAVMDPGLHLQDIAVLEGIPCPPDILPFQSQVVIHANIDLDGLLDSKEKLERALRDAYNRINYFNQETCDVFFRMITDVEIDIQETLRLFYNRRHLEEDTEESVLLVAFYTGQCRGCGEDATLASNRHQPQEQTRRSLFQQQKSQPQQTYISHFEETVAVTAASNIKQRRLEEPVQSTKECLCPEQSDFHYPTTLELETSVYQVLEDFDSVDATDAYEAFEVSCSASVDEFESGVTIVLLTTDGFNAGSAGVVENVFQNTYNDLIGGYCDTSFRGIQGADVIDLQFVPVGRSLEEAVSNMNVSNITTTNHTLGNSTGDNSTMPVSSPVSSPVSPPSITPAPISMPAFFNNAFLQVSISGSCRGCGSGTSLFDDVSARGRKLGTKNRPPSSSRAFRRSLQSGDTCFCPADFVESRSPSVDEFLVAFDEALTAAEETVIGVESLMEGPVMRAPSTVPSSMPSIAPSDSPSDSPSSSPSHSPSLTPSVAPSNPMPSSSPSSFPTSTPSFTPTDTSMVPSDVPSFIPSDLPSQAPSDFTNDACLGAELMVDGDTVTGDTTNATDDTELTCLGLRRQLVRKDDPQDRKLQGELGPGLWYSFVGDDKFHNLTTCNEGTEADTGLAIFTGPCSNLRCFDGTLGTGDCASLSFFAEGSVNFSFVVFAAFGGRRHGAFELSLMS